MLLLTGCTITLDDEVIQGAVVSANGESPNATVQISVPNGRKFSRVDRVLGAAINRSGKSLVIEGRSEYLERSVGTTDSKVTYRVTGHRTCQGCP